MGQKVRVLLDRVDRVNRRLQFAILEDESGPVTPTDGERPAKRGSHPYKPPKGAGKKRSKKSIQREKKAKRGKRK